MRCGGCGASAPALKTVICRADRERRGVLCTACWGPLRDALWIVPGAFTITSRCDSCGAFVRPQDLVESRPGGHGKRDLVSTGLCAECVR